MRLNVVTRGVLHAPVQAFGRSVCLSVARCDVTQSTELTAATYRTQRELRRLADTTNACTILARNVLGTHFFATSLKDNIKVDQMETNWGVGGWKTDPHSCGRWGETVAD
jgi:hypothetical protein